MTRLPVIILLIACAQMAEAKGAPSQAASGLIFAHVVTGGGYSTTFTLANTGATEATGTLAIIGQTGEPLSVDLTGPVSGKGASFAISLNPGATAVLTASRNDATEEEAGWARVTHTGGSLDGVATFHYSQNGTLKSIAGVLASGPVEAAILPVNNQETQGRFSGFAVANPGDTDVHIELSVYGEDGSLREAIRPAELNPLGPQTQAARFLHDYLPSYLTFRGSLRVSGDPGEKASVVALNMDRGVFTVIPVVPRDPVWRLIWSDEFEGPDNSAVDPARWVMDTGGWGWGNDELETYTPRLENAHIEGGMLVITAQNETYTGTDGIKREYTSARLKTQGRFEQKHGRFEARIKLPYGQGIWPAFWLLGNDIDSVGWPTCGEIDIMENIGKEPSTIHGTMHGPGYSGGNGLTAGFSLPGRQRFADDFHVFVVEWDPDAIRWKLDGTTYQTRKPADLPSGTRWVFDHPFFILLNVAVGGNWPGSPDRTTVFPQRMLVDYVRVYEGTP
jgi:hypothetical protein